MFRIVTLTADHYSEKTQMDRDTNKGNLVTYTYITIDGRKFGTRVGAKDSGKSWRCTGNSKKECNMIFQVEEDAENQCGKEVFDKNAQHSE
jgi:hypothetical protein